MKKILVVDDIEINSYFLEVILKEKGYDVAVAINGVEALQKLKTDSFDLIISDILMPVMDGYLFCHECKKDEQLKNIPFIFYSSTFTDLNDKEFAAKLGADKFIQKPADPDLFAEIVADIFQNNKPIKVKTHDFAVDKDDMLKLYSKNLINKLEKKNLELEKEINRRNLAEQKIRISEGKYRSLIEQASDGIALTDFSGKFLEVNKSLSELLGYTAEEFYTMNLIDILPENERTKFPPQYEKLLKGENLIYKRVLLKKNGNTVDVEVNSKMTDENKLIGFIRDISKRKKVEQQLQIQNEELRKLTEYLENVREKERKEMAREIHDELGQQLTGLKMELALLSKKIDPENETVQKRIVEIQELTNLIVTSVRRIIFQLRPSILDDFGLVAALDSFSTEFEKRFQIKTEFIASHEDLDIHPDLAIELFRIFQEAMNNISKYANANYVIATFEESESEYVLAINDDGIGFDSSIRAEKKSYGIMGMKERTNKINGQFEITSELGKGTSVVVRVPKK